MSGRVVILADPDFIRRENPLLSRLEIGLATEGIRIVHAVPERHADDMSSGLYSTIVTYAANGMRVTRRERVRRLSNDLVDIFQSDPDDAVDIVHCFGERVWDIGLELASQTNAALALDVWSDAQLKRAKNVVGAWSRHVPLAVLAPDQPMRRALSRVVPPGSVHLAPWGVHAAEHLHPLLDPAQAIGVALVASGQDVDAIATALEGINLVAREIDRLLVFVDAGVESHSTIWKRRRLDMLSVVTFVPDLEGRRRPTLLTDLVLQPESMGYHHSLTLDAMGAGTLVIAAADPMIEVLIDQKTAMLVDSPTPHTWADAIRRVVNEPERAKAITASARDYVRDHRSASGHVSAVLGVYGLLAEAKGRQTTRSAAGSAAG